MEGEPVFKASTVIENLICYFFHCLSPQILKYCTIKSDIKAGNPNQLPTISHYSHEKNAHRPQIIGLKCWKLCSNVSCTISKY